MELQRARPPPEYSSHSPETIVLPDTPLRESLQRYVQTDVTLPNLKTVLSPQFQQASPPEGSFVAAAGSPASLKGLPRIEPRRQFNSSRKSRDSTRYSASEHGSFAGTEPLSRKTTSVLSADDADLRDAAEALAGLGKPVHAQSPPDTSAHVLSHASPSSSEHPHNLSSDQEPLLYLVTEAHPWFGKTIQGSLAAYATTKGYAPRFVQAGANIVERNIASPIVSTVGNVSRMTGVDSAARWYYARPAGDMERNDEEANRGKRRRVMDEEELMRMRPGPLSPRSAMRRDSEDSRAESLPSYRASKPPSYREEASPATTDRSRQHERPPHNRSWSRQLTTSVAGLGVAMSDRSRHSLVYCLGILSRNSEHIRTVTAALKMVLEQYDQARDQWHQERASETEKGERPRTPDHDEAARRLAEIIKRHCDDIWQTLKNVVHSVSVTVGGALPGNARNFVRNQLMSLPERWQMVSIQTMGESETSRAANRMIAFAQEGLDMINNVNSACQVTLDSAESWANTFGRRPVELVAPNGYVDHDHKMDDAEEETAHSQHGEKQ